MHWPELDMDKTSIDDFPQETFVSATKALPYKHSIQSPPEPRFQFFFVSKIHATFFLDYKLMVVITCCLHKRNFRWHPQKHGPPAWSHGGFSKFLKTL